MNAMRSIIVQTLPFLPHVMYKPEGLRLHSQWCYWKFPFNFILPGTLVPWVNSTSNGDYQENFLGVKAAGT